MMLLSLYSRSICVDCSTGTGILVEMAVEARAGSEDQSGTLIESRIDTTGSAPDAGVRTLAAGTAGGGIVKDGGAGASGPAA